MSNKKSGIEDEVSGNPELEMAIKEIFLERVNKAKKDQLLSQPKVISSLIYVLHEKLLVTRTWLFIGVIVLSIFSLIDCFSSFPIALIISHITPLAGVSLLILVFFEVTKGAGKEIQTEYQQG